MRLAASGLQCSNIIKIITEINNAFISRTNLMVKPCLYRYETNALFTFCNDFLERGKDFFNYRMEVV